MVKVLVLTAGDAFCTGAKLSSALRNAGLLVRCYAMFWQHAAHLAAGSLQDSTHQSNRQISYCGPAATPYHATFKTENAAEQMTVMTMSACHMWWCAPVKTHEETRMRMRYGMHAFATGCLCSAS